MDTATHYPYRQGIWNHQASFDCYCGARFTTLRKAKNHAVRALALLDSGSETLNEAAEKKLRKAHGTLRQVDEFFATADLDNRSVQIAHSVWQSTEDAPQQRVKSFATYLAKTNRTLASVSSCSSLKELAERIK